MQPLYHMYIPGGYFPQPVQALQLPQQPFLFFAAAEDTDSTRRSVPQAASLQSS